MTEENRATRRQRERDERKRGAASEGRAEPSRDTNSKPPPRKSPSWPGAPRSTPRPSESGRQRGRGS
jgi:hypothetical protein